VEKNKPNEIEFLIFFDFFSNFRDLRAQKSLFCFEWPNHENLKKIKISISFGQTFPNQIREFRCNTSQNNVTYFS